MKVIDLKISVILIMLAIIGCSTVTSTANQMSQGPVEPTAELAALWWPPLKNVWTPIGWKNHLFRFNVVYNGTIVAKPDTDRFDRKLYTKKYSGQGVTLTITPSVKGGLPPEPGYEPFQLSDTPDGGVGNQGWINRPTPVLWTEWQLDGVILRKEIFGHITSGKPVETGDEPLYAWIRLKVVHVDELQAPKQVSSIITIGGDDFIKRNMSKDTNLTYHPMKRLYPRLLKAETFGKDSAGIRITESDGRIRIVGLPTTEGSYKFEQRQPIVRDHFYNNRKEYFLRVTLPAVKNAEAVLLLPMLSGSFDDVESEMKLGIDEALRQADCYWSYKPKTASVVDTPEKQVNEAIKHSLKFSEIIAEKNPESEEYSFLSGSWQYDILLPTPSSMTSHMLLDIFGYHSVVEKNIDIYYKHQGTVKPPGDSYDLHPGYFSSPKSLTATNWLCDHGAILYLLSNHALLSGNEIFLDKWLGSIIKGCEFIKDARAINNHEGVKGIMPPGYATDRRVEIQSAWTDAWTYKGLITSVRLLKLLEHPRAEEFEREAADYKKTFVEAFREKAKQMPTWTDTQGKKRPLAPHSLSMGGNITHLFYLDTGPLILVWSELIRADDELMRAATDFFRKGPNKKLYDSRSNFLQRPVLVHEISSGEPCYSWNVFCSWQLGDRYKYLEGMYSLLAGAMSRQTYISCEHRHGIYGNIFASPLFTYLVRLSVIDDEIETGQLHLLRLVPRAWISDNFETKFEDIPTKFGPVTIKFRLGEDNKALKVTYNHKIRYQPKKVVVHVPPIENLSEVVVNGKVFKSWSGEMITIK